MRIGVTGATGFIGRALVGALSESGDHVVTFVRPGADPPTGATIRWDPSRGLIDDADLRREGGLDAVVNLAGAGIGDRRWTVARRAEVLSSRVSSTSLLIGALAARGGDVPHVVSGSAIGIYGAHGDEILDEISPRGAGFLADVCEQWESAALASPGPVALLRSGIVLGAGGGVLARQLPLFRAGLGGTLGDGRQWMSPISLVDEVGAIRWVLEHRTTGPVNLTGPNPVSNREFTKALGHALHRPARLRVPAVALGVVLGRELASELVLASQRVIPRVLRDAGFEFRHPDVASAIHNALATRR